MKILVKTTGAFIIPLGRGEFVLPEASEVEDCALLQSEIRNGRVEFVKSEDSAEPAAEVEAEPAAEVEAEPTAEVEAEPSAEVEAEPAAEVEAEPDAEAEAEPDAEVEAEPAVEPQPVRRGKRNR